MSPDRHAVRHASIRIEGRVQGVGFRWSARLRAVQLRVTGFVRNEDDGSVYIEAEAPEEQLAAFVDWCRQGPRSACVEDVTVTDGAVRGFGEFEVRD